MDDHKPKPNWRGFLKEYAVIVIGVLTALALGQMVENWREHEQYLEAREAMRYELNYNISNLRRRDQFAPCTRRRLGEIGALLDRAENHQPFEAPSWIGDAASLRIRFTAELEASRSGLFSTAEQRDFGRLYGYLHSIDVEQDRERLAWGRLRMLEDRSVLTPEMIYGLRSALADARFEYDRLQVLLDFLYALGGRAEMRGDMNIATTAGGLVFEPQAWPHCLPMNTPKEKAEKVSRTSPRAP